MKIKQIQIKKERQKQKERDSGFVKYHKLEISAPTNIILERSGWKIIRPPGFSKEEAIAAMALVESRNVS